MRRRLADATPEEARLASHAAVLAVAAAETMGLPDGDLVTLRLAVPLLALGEPLELPPKLLEVATAALALAQGGEVPSPDLSEAFARVTPLIQPLGD